MRWLSILTAAPLLAAGSGCTKVSLPDITDLKIPGIYRIPIQQGNVLDDAALARLEPGMSKRKVSFLIGTPAVRDLFHVNRWDYVYTFQPGGGKREQRAISLYFDDDKLERIAGRINAPDPTRAKPKERVVVVPAQRRRRSFFGSLNPWSDDGPTVVPPREEVPVAGAAAPASAIPPADLPANKEPGNGPDSTADVGPGQAPVSQPPPIGSTQAEAQTSTATGDPAKAKSSTEPKVEKKSLFQRMTERLSIPPPAPQPGVVEEALGDR